MGDHTSNGQDAEGVAARQGLQPDRAFVVQLRDGPPTARGLEGRVEHVVSGEALRFGSTAELIEFLTRDGFAASRRGMP
jgi:hypothetical protein